MFKIFISHPKIINAYALFNNCEVLFYVDDDGKMVIDEYGDRKNVCFYIFANEYKYYADKFYKKITFKKLIKLAKANNIEYISYDYERNSFTSLQKILDLKNFLEKKKNRIRFQEKYPIVNEPRGRCIKSYGTRISEYWEAVPLRDFLEHFVMFKQTYPHEFSFVTNNHYYYYNDEKNMLLVEEDGFYYEVELIDKVIDEITPNNDIDLDHLVLSKYGIDLADYICDIEYVDD